MIIENFDKDHKDDYFAMEALYKFTKDEKGNTDQTRDDSYEPKFIRLEKDGYEYINVKKQKSEELRYQFMFTPTQEKAQRNAIFAQGQAGSGKTYSFKEFSELYHMIHPNNAILYFSMNNHEMDRSLQNRELYKFIPMQEFCESLEEISKDLNELKESAKIFKNSLLIFDDLAKLKSNKKYEKIFWCFIDGALEDMRKIGTSVYLISHSSRTGHFGKSLKEEMTQYIIYPQSIQTQNDRILEAVFGWKSKTLDKLFSQDTSRFMCIDCKKRVITTPNEIFTVKYLLSN